MGHPRLPRFKRSDSIGHLSLTERDLEILRHVRRHRFLTSVHITSLVAGSAQQILRRLQLMYHHGLLERPTVQLDYYHHGGPRPMVYGLGNKGADLLNAEGASRYPEARSIEATSAVRRVYLEHALLVSDIMVAIGLACRESGQIRLIAGYDLPLPPETAATFPIFRWSAKAADGQSIGLMPDQAFALKLEDPLRTEPILFFLEADRGTMPVTRGGLSQTSFYRKLLAYEATWSQDIHTKRFGFERLRVLTVAPNAERLKSLMEACSKLERGQGLFLFTDRASILTPDAVFSRIWHSTRHEESVSILD